MYFIYSIVPIHRIVQKISPFNESLLHKYFLKISPYEAKKMFFYTVALYFLCNF